MAVLQHHSDQVKSLNYEQSLEKANECLRILPQAVYIESQEFDDVKLGLLEVAVGAHEQCGRQSCLHRIPHWLLISMHTVQRLGPRLHHATLNRGPLELGKLVSSRLDKRFT